MIVPAILHSRKRGLRWSQLTSKVYDSIKQAIKDAGSPIALVDAIKIAASKDPKVRDYFAVDDSLSEEDRCLWRLIYELVSQGPNSRRISVVQLEPLLIVSYSV
jgi:hypothetical protein